MKQLLYITLFVFLFPLQSLAGSGLSVWGKLAVNDSVSSTDMIGITDISDTAQSAAGTSKSITAAQLKTYVQGGIADEITFDTYSGLAPISFGGKAVQNPRMAVGYNAPSEMSLSSLPVPAEPAIFFATEGNYFNDGTGVTKQEWYVEHVWDVGGAYNYIRPIFGVVDKINHLPTFSVLNAGTQGIFLNINDGTGTGNEPVIGKNKVFINATTIEFKSDALARSNIKAGAAFTNMPIPSTGGIMIGEYGGGPGSLSFYASNAGNGYGFNMRGSGDGTFRMEYRADSQTWSDLLTFNTSGMMGMKTATPTALLDINSDTIRLRTAKTPSSATETCNAGTIAWDASAIYVCVAADTWEKTALSTW